MRDPMGRRAKRASEAGETGGCSAEEEEGEVGGTVVSKERVDDMEGVGVGPVDMRVYTADAGVGSGERTRRRGTRGVLETLCGKHQRCVRRVRDGADMIDLASATSTMTSRQPRGVFWVEEG